MPFIELTFPSYIPTIKITAYLSIDKIELDEHKANISFKIEIHEPYNNLQLLDKIASRGYKLILEDFRTSDEHTFQIGSTRIDTRNLKQLFHRDDFMQDGFINKIDGTLKQGFTVQDLTGFDNDVKIYQDKIVFTRNLSFSAGSQYSTPGTRTFVSSNIPFISYLHCVLKDFLDDKEAKPGSVPPEFLQFYNKDHLNTINAVFLQYFLEQCKSCKIAVTLSPSYIRSLKETRDRMVDSFDRLLKSVTPQQPQVPFATPEIPPAPTATPDVLMRGQRQQM